MNVKQVLVMRRRYQNEKGESFSLRLGKLIAQGSHASMSFLTRQLQQSKTIDLTPVQQAWIDNGFAKICLYVDDEAQLLEIFEKAKAVGLEVHLITDSGKTEFHGVPTLTCLAIGPDLTEKIDTITGHLPLL